MIPARPAFADVAGSALATGAVAAMLPPLSVLALISGYGALTLACGAGRRSAAVALGVTLLAGWLIGSWRLDALDADPLAARVGHAVVDAEVEVAEAWHGGGYGRIALGRILGPDGGRVLLRLDGRTGPERGSILRANGSLERPRGPQRDFDERSWLAHQGVHAVLRLRDAEVIGARRGLWGVVDRVRAAALAALAPSGHDDAGQVVVGLVLGGSADMTPDAVEAFRASGLAHLLAVSGGNVALLLALVIVLVWAAGGNRRQAMVIGVGAIALYVGVVGPSPSVVRAGIAGTAGCLVWLLGRPRDAWRALGLGLGLLLAWNPYALFDPGLQLSFAAVAAILLVVPRIAGWSEATGLPRILVAAVAVTAAATVATAPISWWHFGRATILAAIPANLLAAPAVPLVLWSALVGILLTPIAPAAGAGVAWCAHWPAAWILQCAWLGTRLAAATPMWLLPGLLAAVVGAVAARRRQ